MPLSTEGMSTVIDLRRLTNTATQIHRVENDPGVAWTTKATIAIDAPPDHDLMPNPGATWPPAARRTGLCGTVSPRVVMLPEGLCRLYYTQILPRPGFPAGANDYENATTRILSAVSSDGECWRPEDGVRLSPESCGDGVWRVVSSEVVPMVQQPGFRMYFECCCGPHSEANSIRSAVSADGLNWTVEAGSRLESSGANFAAPRVVFLDDGRVRLYCLERGRGIVSAISRDGGETFEPEPGVRIAPGASTDRLVTFAPEIVRVAGAGYVMYYAGYESPQRASIHRAESDDGLLWRKADRPVISPSGAGWDAVKCSEMCLVPLSHAESGSSGYRMLYEACDGTAPDKRGVWRIASVTTTQQPG